ncbi:MAG: hypothetical protein M3O23_12895 [Actinomycetota bacterium]|nr:hypothetical protein [Actinomycetota bacterium]
MTPTDDDDAVLRYLAAIEVGRTATDDLPQPDTAAAALAGADMVTGDDQEGLEVQLAEQAPGSGANVRTLEDDFVRAAPGYAERHAITYEGWRNSGVAPDVLERAGIRPSER